jgi:exonuclease VII small subunit
MAQNNLGMALESLGEGESGTVRLEEALAAYRAVLEERSRDREPGGWAITQACLGRVLRILGRRENGTTRLEEAVAAWGECLKIADSTWPAEWASQLRTRQDETRAEINRRLAK